jgi:hypothetical protein
LELGISIRLLPMDQIGARQGLNKDSMKGVK